MGKQKKDDIKPEINDLKQEKEDLKQEISDLKQEIVNEKKVEKFEASSVINSSELRESDFLKKEVKVSNSEIMVTETENVKELTKVEETTSFKKYQLQTLRKQKLTSESQKPKLSHIIIPTLKMR